MPAIEVSHVTKEYRLGTLQGLRQAALNAGRRLLGRPVEERPLFKALDDVSFSVEPARWWASSATTARARAPC